MNCRQIFEALSEYIDDDLDPGVCDEIEQHMQGCAPCQAFLNTLQRTVDFCRDTTVPPLTAQQKADLREMVRRACAESRETPGTS